MQPVEKARFIGDPAQHYRLAALQNQPDDALAGLVANRVSFGRILAVNRTHQQFATGVQQRHHAALHPGAFMQHLQHPMQGFPQIERTTENLADLVQRRQFDFQQFGPTHHASNRFIKTHRDI